MASKTYVELGEEFQTELPYSEVCMHMRVAGTTMTVVVVGPVEQAVAQLYKDGRPFSFPITLGEAGVFRDEFGFYYYKEVAA